MKTIYSMCLLYRDDVTSNKLFCGKVISIKKTFVRKDSALQWFNEFRLTNKRPVTITFYTGFTPNWVFTQN